MGTSRGTVRLGSPAIRKETRMQEQRKNVEDRCRFQRRQPETLGEGLSIDVHAKLKNAPREFILREIRTSWKGTREVAALIDSRFAPLIAAAEVIVKRGPMEWQNGKHNAEVLDALAAAIANAKGGAK